MRRGNTVTATLNLDSVPLMTLVIFFKIVVGIFFQLHNSCMSHIAAVVVSLLLILSRQKEKPQHTSKPFLSIFLSLPHHVLVMSCEAIRAVS